MIPLFSIWKIFHQYLIGSYVDDNQGDNHKNVLNIQSLIGYIIDDISHHPDQRSDTEIEELPIGKI